MNSTAWELDHTLRPLRVTRLTAGAGTFIKLPEGSFAIVRLQGAGCHGAMGGYDPSGNGGVGGAGGGAGGHLERRLVLDAATAYQVGAAGTVGGSTVFGTLRVPGGRPGKGNESVTLSMAGYTPGGAGGRGGANGGLAGGGGTSGMPGESGTPPGNVNSSMEGSATGGAAGYNGPSNYGSGGGGGGGGDSPMGRGGNGGAGGTDNPPGPGVAGAAATGFGSGGGGGGGAGGGFFSAVGGGLGRDGCIEIEEY